LTKHRLDICAAAKELGVNRTDLRRLTWHDPKLLDEAKWACDLYVVNCRSLMIRELFGPNKRKRERAAEQILSSSMAYGHPLATLPRSAPRPKPKSNRPLSPFFVEMNRQKALKKAERENFAQTLRAPPSVRLIVTEGRRTSRWQVHRKRRS
jgi:hypothetical protein